MYKSPTTTPHNFPVPDLTLARAWTTSISCLYPPGAVITIRKGKQLQPFPLVYLREGMLRADGESTCGLRHTCLASGEEVKSGDPGRREMPAFTCTSCVTFIGCKTHSMFLPHVQCKHVHRINIFHTWRLLCDVGIQITWRPATYKHCPPFFFLKKSMHFFLTKAVCGKH